LFSSGKHRKQFEPTNGGFNNRFVIFCQVQIIAILHSQISP